jgi:hypothetical protein
MPLVTSGVAKIGVLYHALTTPFVPTANATTCEVAIEPEAPDAPGEVPEAPETVVALFTVYPGPVDGLENWTL